MHRLLIVLVGLCWAGLSSGQEVALRDRADGLTAEMLAGEPGESPLVPAVVGLMTEMDPAAVDAATAASLGRAMRLARLLDGLEGTRARRARSLFGADRGLMDEFLFALGEDDPPTATIRELFNLVDHDAEGVGSHPRLASAIAVVHNGFGVMIDVNENTGSADEPEEIFGYFVRNQRRLNYPSESLPVELLAYVVDAPAGITEMEWALDRYQGDKQVGRRFFDISYDREHAYRGKEKRSTAAGWGLPAIRQHGGVCADQTYFAVMVGKSLGVPSVYTSGRSGDISHAWVGFLESRGGRAWWNFDTGRYKAYQGVRGAVINPRTNEELNDSSVALLARLIGVPPEDRFAAIAYADIASVLLEDTESTGDALAMLRQSVTLAPGLERPWRMVADMAERGRLSLEQKKDWSGAVIRVCGKAHPDFVFDLLKPMIASVDDTKEQDKLWRAAGKITGKRKDLAAEVKLAQGDMWAGAGDQDRAWKCYDEILTKYMNDTPLAYDAVRRMDDMLSGAGLRDQRVPLYKRAWQRCDRPDYDAYFSSSSNYARIGKRYVSILRAGGNRNEADRVQRIIAGE